MNTKTSYRHRRIAVLAALGAGAAVAAVAAVTATSSAAPAYGTVATGGIGTAPDKTVASLVAPDGDRDPFGIAIVPLTMGKLTAGNLLVAEFGDKHGTAGAGTTILQVNPATGKTSVFFRGGPVAGPVGVAINPADDGVWVGDYGKAASGTAANDLLIAPNGKVKAVYTGATTHGAASFAGVWGQGVSSSNGKISFYYGNAGNASTGTGGGNVVPLTPHPKGPVNGQPVNATYARIATGQGETPRGGNAAAAAGPQGYAFAADGTLYQTNDADNTLYAIPRAATTKFASRRTDRLPRPRAAKPGERRDRPAQRRPACGERQRQPPGRDHLWRQARRHPRSRRAPARRSALRPGDRHQSRRRPGALLHQQQHQYPPRTGASSTLREAVTRNPA